MPLRVITFKGHFALTSSPMNYHTLPLPPSAPFRTHDEASHGISLCWMHHCHCFQWPFALLGLRCIALSWSQQIEHRRGAQEAMLPDGVEASVLSHMPQPHRVTAIQSSASVIDLPSGRNSEYHVQ